MTLTVTLTLTYRIWTMGTLGRTKVKGGRPRAACGPGKWISVLPVPGERGLEIESIRVRITELKYVVL